MTEWQITKSFSKIYNVSSKSASIRNLSHKIRNILDQEQKVRSKGKETKFRRNNDKSEEIGRKYRIMKVLQSEATKLLGSKNASLLSRTENSQLCQSLTAEFSKPDCLPSECDSSESYRSIDGCCNNLESPTQGIIIIQFLTKQNKFSFIRHGK